MQLQINDDHVRSLLSSSPHFGSGIANQNSIIQFISFLHPCSKPGQTDRTAPCVLSKSHRQLHHAICMYMLKFRQTP